jgi:Fic family protein
MDKKRQYEETHPWISFTADMRDMSPRFWMKLGEAASKCDHVAGVPLRPDFAQGLHRLFLAKGALGTTAIEGNTLTEEQVIEHLEGKLVLPASKEYLKREIENVVSACNEISRQVFAGEAPPLSRELICEFNRKVLSGLTADDQEVIPGAVRQHSVTVGNYRGAPWQDCEWLLDRTCEWLNNFCPEGYPATSIALLKAVLAHLYFAWIHPFGDGNGRTARLIEFYILLRAGVASPIPHLLSNFYNETRSEYYRQLDRASKAGGDPTSFLEYALDGFVDGLKMQLAIIRAFQWHLAWHDYLREFFSDKKKSADHRRLELMVALSDHIDPIPVHKVTRIDPDIATMYAEFVPRTLDRDLAILEDYGLIEIKNDKVRTKMEKVLQFLPSRLMNTEEQLEVIFPKKVLREIVKEDV